MARRIEPLPAFPKELAYLGWTLIKAQGTSALKAVNSRLHCTSPNFASDGRAWAKKKAERAAAKGALPEPPHVRAEIVEWACGSAHYTVDAAGRKYRHTSYSVYTASGCGRPQSPSSVPLMVLGFRKPYFSKTDVGKYLPRSVKRLVSRSMGLLHDRDRDPARRGP